jgi:hypothetical protein
MFLITYIARPMATSPEWNEAEGAYVNAWIEATSAEAADAVARSAIREICKQRLRGLPVSSARLLVRHGLQA